MKLNDRFDTALYQAIRELIDRGKLAQRSPGHRIAQQVIHEGYDSLSAEQRKTYDAVVTPALVIRARDLETLWVD